MVGHINGIPYAQSGDRVDQWPTTSRAIAQWVDDNVPRNDDPRLTNARPPTTHTHPISGVTGLQDALDGKTDTTDPRLSDARPPTTHTHEITDVDGLKAIIDRLTYDSGWRVIPLRDGWTGEVRVRRTANTVEVIINGIVRGEGAGLVAFDLPAGFGVPLVRPVLTDTSNPPALSRTYVGGSTVFNVVVGVGQSARYGSFMTNTFDPIPTTLPGTPA